MDLTKNGVLEIFNNFSDKKELKTQLTLQVSHVSSEQKSSDLMVQTLKLSDGDNTSFSGIHIVSSISDVLKQYQILKIYAIKYAYHKEDSSVKTFLLQKFDVLASVPFLIGKPSKCIEETLRDRKFLFLPQKVLPIVTPFSQLTSYSTDFIVRARINKKHEIKITGGRSEPVQFSI